MDRKNFDNGKRNESTNAIDASTGPGMTTVNLVNPFREGLKTDRATAPCLLVIFGASGDLTSRKLLPAIYNLAQADLLPPSFSVVGFSRDSLDETKFRDKLRDAVATSGDVRVKDDAVLARLVDRTHYVGGDFHDPASYARLRTAIEQFDKQYATGGNVIFYIATPASLFGDIVEQLHEAGLAHTEEGGRFVRIIVEKPFGRDYAS